MHRRLLPLLLGLPLIGGLFLFSIGPAANDGWEPFRPDETTIADCVDPDPITDLRCLRQAYANLAWNDGVAAAMRELWVDEARQERTLRWCHRIAHLVGEAAWSREGERLEGAIPEISADFEADPRARAYFLEAGDCVDGLFHGLLEREFAERPDPVRAIDELADLCARSEIWDDDPEVSALRCVHGIGHGTMIVSNNDLERSLALCDRTARLDAAWPGLCASGVFMEYAAPTVAGGSLVDPAAPFADCTPLRKVYGELCYQHVVRVLLEGGVDPLSVAPRCEEIALFEGRAACAFEIGSSLYETTIDDPASFGPLIGAACPLLAPHLLSCLNGALEEASHAPDPLLGVAATCESLPTSLHYACGIVAELRRDWRELSPSGCDAIGLARARAGCEWSAAAGFDPRSAPDPDALLD
jgi:hypothetical protein